MESTTYRCGAFVLDTGNRRFSHGDAEVTLEHKVFAVVVELLRSAGDLVTREELLDAVWGHRFVTPSTLNRTIALARRAFDDRVDAPRFIQTVRGVGYRFIGTVERDDGDSDDVEARFAPPASMRLPARLEPLIGREDELELLATLLREHRAVTVLGTGGMGKTVCALEAARRAEESFPDGVWFFDLAPVQAAEDWLKSLGTGLLVQTALREELLDKICGLLAGRRALLVLDNCDRIAAETGQIVLDILRRTSDVRVLSTSQQPLSFIGEQIMPMPALQLPAADRQDRIDAAAIASVPACALLIARARAVQPGFAVTAANGATIVAICRHLDGMPLALELAAARFALLSPEQVLDRLTARLRFLASDAAGRDPRHHNLLALLDWSYRLLSDAEQRYLVWLSVFVQGWTVDSAVDLAAPLGHDASSAVDLLTGLVNKSLVTVDLRATPPRYRLLETVREFALEQLRASGEENEARLAHLAWVRRLAADVERNLLAGHMHEQITAVMREDGNITSALEHAHALPGGRESALQITGSLILYLKGRGSYLSAMYWCDLALDGNAPLDSASAARALLGKAVLALHMVQTREIAEPMLLEAGRVASATGDRWTEAYASGYRSMCLTNAGGFDGAFACAELTARIGEELHDPVLQGLAGLARGWILLARGSFHDAIRELSAVEDLGPDLHQRHFIKVYIGLVHYELGEWQPAAQRLLDGLRTAAGYRNVRGMAGSVEGCGYIAVELGLHAQAAEMLGAAAAMRDRTAVPLFNFWVRHNQHAHAAARRALGSKAYAEHVAIGKQMRDEDSIHRAASMLRSFAAGESAVPLAAASRSLPSVKS